MLRHLAEEVVDFRSYMRRCDQALGYLTSGEAGHGLELPKDVKYQWVTTKKCFLLVVLQKLKLGPFNKH